MLNIDSKNILRLFPWDICRRIYANPANDHIYTIRGVSYDWEHLLSSSFVDAKTIIREWLVYRRKVSKPDEVDYFTDLFIPHTENDFKSTVYARAILFQDHNYFGIIAMSYLYLCGVYLEENDILAVYCALNYTTSQQINSKDNSINDEGLCISVPHWYTLAKWLQHACDDLNIFNIGGTASTIQPVDNSLPNANSTNSVTKNNSKKRQRNVFNMAQIPADIAASNTVSTNQPEKMHQSNRYDPDKTMNYTITDSEYYHPNLTNNTFHDMKVDTFKSDEKFTDQIAAKNVKSMRMADTNRRYNSVDALDIINNLSCNPQSQNFSLGKFQQSSNNNFAPNNNNTMAYSQMGTPMSFQQSNDGIMIKSNADPGLLQHKINSNTFSLLGNNSHFGMQLNNINNNSLLGNLTSSIGLNPSLSAIGSSGGLPGYSTNYTDQLMISNLISQNIINQQQLNQHSLNQQMVNRRQKKNRDKFKFTFQLSQDQAADLLNKQLVLESDLISAAEYEETLKALMQIEAENNVASTALFTSPGDVFYSILVPLKGIDVLPNRRYRVQLNTFMKGRKKFSRNSLDLYEALWIFEIALLISDSPTQLAELQRIGNYNCLSMLGYLRFFSTSSQYYMELGRHIMMFYDTLDFFCEELITIAIKNFDALKPSFEYAPLEPLANFLSKQSGTSSGNLFSNISANNELVSNSTEVLEENYKEPVWMQGFHKALSLKDQKLSCLYCFRRFPIPKQLPRISMIREKDEKSVVNSISNTTEDMEQIQIHTHTVLQSDQLEEDDIDVNEEDDDDDDVIFVGNEDGVYSEPFCANDDI